MAKFKNLDQLKKEFLVRSNGGERLAHHSTRYSDLTNYAPVVERLLDTDYNRVSGFSFSEIMEAISMVAENYSSADYVNAIHRDSKATKLDESFGKEVSGEDNFWACSEALNTATTAQAPYPVPSIALTTYQYEKAVLPYLCHQFDLKGNRGLVYYQKITAENAKGNVKAGDLLGSPKEMGVQPASFVGTKNVERFKIADLVAGQAEYTPEGGALPGAPLQAGSLVINIDGMTGYFKDFAQEGNPDTVALYAVGGDIGTAVVTLSTGTLTITLKDAPTTVTGGMAIYATYCRDIEKTVDGGKANMARAQVSLESKQLEAEDFSVFTETSIYQEALSKAIFGLDWNSQVDEALAALYNKEVANKIVAEIEQAIPTESIYTKSLATATGGNNELFNVQFMAVVMGKLGQLITTASGIGNNKLAALVINIEVLPIIRALPKFTAANADFEEVMGGMYLAGLYDGMPVIVGFPVYNEAGETIALGSGEVIGIYKSKNKDFLTPYCWGTFILPIIRDIFDQDNLAVNRKQLISSAAGAVVAERLAAKLTITDIDDVLG